MTLVVDIFIILTVLWMAWVCVRAFTLRIPGQTGMYRELHTGKLLAELAGMGIFLYLAAEMAALGVWYIAALLLGFDASFAWTLTYSLMQTAAFSDAGFALRGLIGSTKTFRWADVSACTVREAYVGKTTVTLVRWHYLTLPHCTLRVGDHTDTGRLLLRTLTRQRKDLKAIRQPERTGT